MTNFTNSKQFKLKTKKKKIKLLIFVDMEIKQCPILTASKLSLCKKNKVQRVYKHLFLTVTVKKAAECSIVAKIQNLIWKLILKFKKVE